MTCIHDLSPIRNDLVITHSDEAFVWDSRWHATAGVSALSITADIRNVGLGTSAAMAIKPAVQLATVRTDRPDAGAAITAGSAITAAGLTHFVETLSASSKGFFRVGWSVKLTAGSFARAEALLHVSYRACGRMFTPRELVFQPVNNTAAPSYFPLTGVFPTAGVDKGRLLIVGLDNANSTLQWRLAGRAFNDPMARGAWSTPAHVTPAVTYL